MRKFVKRMSRREILDEWNNVVVLWVYLFVVFVFDGFLFEGLFVVFVEVCVSVCASDCFCIVSVGVSLILTRSTTWFLHWNLFLCCFSSSFFLLTWTPSFLLFWWILWRLFFCFPTIVSSCIISLTTDCISFFSGDVV